jgi:hypothetical protein
MEIKTAHGAHTPAEVSSPSPLSGSSVAEALKERARMGLDVRVLYDAIGSQTTPSAFFRDMAPSYFSSMSASQEQSIQPFTDWYAGHFSA